MRCDGSRSWNFSAAIGNGKLHIHRIRRGRLLLEAICRTSVSQPRYCVPAAFLDEGPTTERRIAAKSAVSTQVCPPHRLEISEIISISRKSRRAALLAKGSLTTCPGSTIDATHPLKIDGILSCPASLLCSRGCLAALQSILKQHVQLKSPWARTAD